MAQTPKKKRRRTVPANLAEKSDREIMERLFGKRVLKEVDTVLETRNAKPPEVSMTSKVTG